MYSQYEPSVIGFGEAMVLGIKIEWGSERLEMDDSCSRGFSQRVETLMRYHGDLCILAFLTTDELIYGSFDCVHGVIVK